MTTTQRQWQEQKRHYEAARGVIKILMDAETLGEEIIELSHHAEMLIKTGGEVAEVLAVIKRCERLSEAFGDTFVAIHAFDEHFPASTRTSTSATARGPDARIHAHMKRIYELNLAMTAARAAVVKAIPMLHPELRAIMACIPADERAEAWAEVEAAADDAFRAAAPDAAAAAAAAAARAAARAAVEKR